MSLHYNMSVSALIIRESLSDKCVIGIIKFYLIHRELYKMLYLVDHVTSPNLLQFSRALMFRYMWLAPANLIYNGIIAQWK